MEIWEIPAFNDRWGNYFYGARFYAQNGKGILVEKNGHILLIDCSIAEGLKNGKIPEKLKNKFIQRGFVGMEKKSPVFIAPEMQIRPEFFMIDLTNRCNMNCVYCLRNTMEEGKVLSENRLRDICSYIQEYCDKEQLPHISIQAWGGEPLLYIDLIEKIRKFIQPEKTKVHISVETNGVLLDEKNIKYLYRNKIGIGISIDGTKELHNAQRIFLSGRGTYDLVSENLINTLKIYGERMGTITTITRKNAPYIEEILEHLAVDMKLRHVKFNFVHESCFSDCNEYCLSSEEIAETEKRLLKKLVSLCENGVPIVEHHIQVKLKNLLYRQYSDICHSCGCCGGKRMIVFDREGGIFPCELTDLPEYRIGSIDERIPLIDIIRRAVAKENFFKKKKENVCLYCDWYCFCQGGCTVRVLSKGKQPPAIDQIECAVNSVLYPALIRLILEKPVVVNSLVGRSVLDE